MTASVDPRPFAARLADHWPEGAPEWIVALAEACDRIGQRRAGEAIGYTGSLVSTVLKGRYGARLDRIEAAVRGAFMAATVPCPVQGEIAVSQCLKDQKVRAEDAIGNGFRVRLWRACRSCQHYRTKEAPDVAS